MSAQAPRAWPTRPPGSSAPTDASTAWRDASGLGVEPSRLLHTADTSIGQSGSPLFATLPHKADAYHAVGVHNYGYDTYNAATRFDDAVFSQIAAWRNESEA